MKAHKDYTYNSITKVKEKLFFKKKTSQPFSSQSSPFHVKYHVQLFGDAHYPHNFC